MALDIGTLVRFVKKTQPLVWQRFEKQCNSDPLRKFYKCFEDAVASDGLVSVLRHGFKHRGRGLWRGWQSPGSGKSNSIAWTAYRLASLHNRQ